MTWQKRIVTSLLRTRDLQTTLETLVHLIEDLNPGVLCTVMRLSDNRLFFAAGPSFPDFYHEAVDGVEIGEGVGSCGTAAFRGETVIVENLYSHPYWANFRGLMSAVGVASCWSEPVRTHEGRILGTFALYRRKPHIPSAQELEQIKVFADLTAIFMEFCAADQTRQITEQRLLHVVADIPGALYEFRLTRDGTMSLPFLSEGIRRLTGHALGPVVPDARALLMNIATGDRRAALLDSILHSAQTLTPWASDLPLPGDDGPRWLRCEARPRRHPDGSVVWAGVMTDITRDKQKAQQDHATTTALAQTNAALEGFVTTAAEDLSDPLRMIAGFLALLRRRLAPVMDEETREVIDFAVENAQRLEDHVGTLLAYTQSQNEPEAVVALDTVLAESLTLLCTRHPRVNERLRVETPLPSVVGRKTQLILVFQAVLEAFLRPPFTGVTLRTREGESDWEITFASADLRVSGDLPLGLAMARHILTAHQGSLSLEAGRATLRLLKKGEG
nr:GAF domain-containing protein [Pararhodospirillum photometricum]